MCFHCGPYLVSISSRIGHSPGHSVISFWEWQDPSRLQLQPHWLVPVLHPHAPLRFDSGYTLLEMIVTKRHQYCCFRPSCLPVKLYFSRPWSSDWLACLSKFLNLINQANAESSVSRNLVCRGTYGNVPVSSQWPVVTPRCHNGFCRPYSASYYSRLLICPSCTLDSTPPIQALLMSANNDPLLAVSKQEYRQHWEHPLVFERWNPLLEFIGSLASLPWVWLAVLHCWQHWK